MPSPFHAPRLAVSLPRELLLSVLLMMQPVLGVPPASQPLPTMDSLKNGDSLQKSEVSRAEELKTAVCAAAVAAAQEHAQQSHPHLHIHPGTRTPGLSSHALAAAIALTTTVCGMGSENATADEASGGETAVAAQRESVAIVQPPEFHGATELPSASARPGMRLGMHSAGQAGDAHAARETAGLQPSAGALAAVSAVEDSSMPGDGASLLPLVRGSGPPPVESIVLSEGSLPGPVGSVDVLPLRPRHPPRVEVVPLGPTLANQRSTLSGDFFVGLASKPWVPIISGIFALLLAGWIVVLLKE